MEEVDAEDADEGFEGCSEAGLDGEEVEGDRGEGEGEGEEDGAGDAAAEGEGEAEEAAEGSEGVVEFADPLEEEAVLDGVGDSDPEEVEAFECVGGEAAVVGGDEGLGGEVFLVDVGDFAEGLVGAELGVGGVVGDGGAPGEALMLFEDGLVELGAEVAAGGDEGVEDVPVAIDPGGKTGGTEDSGEGGSGKELAGGLEERPGHPEAAGGKEEEEGGVEEGDEAPKEAEEGP